MKTRDKIILFLAFVIFWIAVSPLVIKGIETEQDMRRASVQQLFNKP